MPRNNPALPALTPGVPVLRLTTQVLSQSQQYQVITDYIASVPIACNLAVQTAFLTAWRANVEASWAAVLASNLFITEYILAEIAIGTCPTLVTPVNVAGTNASATSLNGILAAQSEKLSAVKGQHGRGRLFIGPIPTSFTAPAVDPNAIVAAGVTAYALLNTKLLLPIVAGGATWNLAITTRPIRPATLTTNGVPVSLMIVNPNMATVRRRKEGRGI